MSESPVPMTFSSLRDHVASLGARLDAFEETQQLRTDDLRDAAAAAGEALERTKGLQVPDILRRLNGAERRINSMDGGRVANTTDDRLLTAVNELTTVMRELVRQGVRQEAAPAAPVQCGTTRHPYPECPCVLPSGHAGRHRDHDGDTWTEVPPTCTATLVYGVDEMQRMYPCDRPAGHPGMHRDGRGEAWTVTSVGMCPAVWDFHGVGHPCTLTANHDGHHRDSSGSSWRNSRV